MADPNASKMVVMGPVTPPVLPQWMQWKCGTKHFDGHCHCTPPLVHRVDMAETAAASGRYVLGALHKQPVPGKLSQEDLDFLAWSCAKIAAHWGRLALGMENLL